jgi:hypothetical protein
MTIVIPIGAKMSFEEARLPRSEHQQACLRLLQDIYEVSAAVATRTYVWGGMVVDILSGEYLRVHRDIDGFTLDLLSVKTGMARLFSERGYATTYADEYGMLTISKGELHAALNRLEIDGRTAMWRHVGDQGTICFPAEWLDATPRCFYGIDTYISGAEFEYAIKTNAHLLNPEWQLRDKDRAAIGFLSAELDRMGVDKSEIPSRIWSYTPYWAERGYPEYARCVTARHSAFQPPRAAHVVSCSAECDGGKWIKQ